LRYVALVRHGDSSETGLKPGFGSTPAVARACFDRIGASGPDTEKPGNVIRIEEDPAACEQLWKAISPGLGPWDDWELMSAYHDPELHRLRFLVREESGQATGLVPLVYDSENDRYLLYGGSYADARVLWLDYKHFPEFFEHFPEKTRFFDLNGRWVDGLLDACPEYHANFAEQEQRYFLRPRQFDFDFDNHIRRFSPDKRQGFLYDLRKIRERNPLLRWSDDDEADFFAELANRNFGDDSDYASASGRRELGRVIAELRRSGRLCTLTIELEGSKEAVSMSLHDGDTWVALYAASNRDQKNLGKLLNVETIQEACRRRVGEINYMTGMQWKAAWDMESETCRTMRKPPAAP